MATRQQAPAKDRDDEDEDKPELPPDERDAPARRMSNARPGMLHKRFKLPSGCTDRQGNAVREVIVRELDGNDELEASLWTEQNAPPRMLESPAGQIAAEQRELVRISIVEVDGEEVNVDGVPWMGMDEWTLKTFRAVRLFYTAVNTYDDGEMRKSLAGAQVVAGLAPAGRGGARRAG